MFLDYLNQRSLRVIKVESFKVTKIGNGNSKLAFHPLLPIRSAKTPQPAGYFLESGPMNGQKMGGLVKDVVKRLADIGLTTIGKNLSPVDQ